MLKIAPLNDDRIILPFETINNGLTKPDAFNNNLPDLEMPRMDGIDLVQRLQQKSRCR